MTEAVGTIRALHVDDEPSVAETARALLEREDERFSVETAGSAEEGLERLTGEEFDCIIADYDMPGQDGIELLYAVRERYPELPYVLFTGKGSEAVASEAIAAGVTDYLQKGGGIDQYAVLSKRVADAVETTRSERRLQTQIEHSERYRHEIYRIATASETVPEEKIQQLLTLGCELLGVENGHVAEIDREAGRHTIRFAAGSAIVERGTVTDLAETFCRRTVETGDLLEIGSEHTDGQHEVAHERWGIGCYIGTPLTVEADPFGTLCFVDRQPRRRPFTETERTLIDLLARSVSQVLESKRARQRQREIFDRMTDAVVSVDEHGTLTYVNDRGREILEAALGDTRIEPVEGQRIWDAVPEFGKTSFPETCRAAMDSQQPTSIREYYEPAGRWFDIRMYPSETGVSVYIRDVSESAEQQAELRARERTLRELYEVSSDTTLAFHDQVRRLLEVGRRAVGADYGSFSRVQDDEYVFEVVSPAESPVQAGDVMALSETYCERTVTTGAPIAIADIEADAPELTSRACYREWGTEAYVGTPLTVGETMYGTVCFYGPDSRESFSEWEVTLVELIGKWLGYELDRQRNERQLRRQNERLEQFASVVSHDLRNPLQVAIGQLELAEVTCDSPHHGEIAYALARMEELIGDLLTLAREGDRVGTLETVDLGALVDRCWQTVETAEATLHVGLETECWIYADRSRLQQLLENLIRNGVEHGGRDVTITVGALEDESGFYVEDDGEGFPDGTHAYEELFEPGVSTSSDGTGFGLSIVDRIVEAHGWTITPTEGTAGGARFEIRGVESVSGGSESP